MEETLKLITTIAPSVSCFIAMIALIQNSITNNKKSNRERKQATLDAFKILQEQALDELNKLTKSDYEDIAYNSREANYEKKYNHCKSLLARCEHFAVGVQDGIYDLSVVSSLAKNYLIHLYDKVLPIITIARIYSGTSASFAAFETLVNDLKKI